MSTVRIDQYDKNGRLKMEAKGNGYFLYTAFAPMSPTEVLVKVGISTIPYERLVALYCNCPFLIELAAFTMVGTKRMALRAEREILGSFETFKTRGEWLRLSSEKATQKAFAESCRRTIASVTNNPVTWKRVSQQQIKVFMSGKMKDRWTA